MLLSLLLSPSAAPISCSPRLLLLRLLLTRASSASIAPIRLFRSERAERSSSLRSPLDSSPTRRLRSRSAADAIGLPVTCLYLNLLSSASVADRCSDCLLRSYSRLHVLELLLLQCSRLRSSRGLLRISLDSFTPRRWRSTAASALAPRLLRSRRTRVSPLLVYSFTSFTNWTSAIVLAPVPSTFR